MCEHSIERNAIYLFCSLMSHSFAFCALHLRALLVLHETHSRRFQLSPWFAASWSDLVSSPRRLICSARYSPLPRRTARARSQLIASFFRQLSGRPVPFLLVWILAGGLSLCAALCFAELSAAMPQAGGSYVYLKTAYGPPVGFILVWSMYFVRIHILGCSTASARSHRAVLWRGHDPFSSLVPRK